MMHQPKLYKAAFRAKAATPLMKHAHEEMFTEIGRIAHAPSFFEKRAREARCEKRVAIDTEQRA
jgi:hypothetical protein